MKTNKKNSGFTLIELVVVIAIIGVLASVVAPKIRVALMKSKDAKVVANLSALRTAANVYYAEQGKLPAGAVPAANTVVDVTAADIARLRDANYLDLTSAKRLMGAAADADTTAIIIAAGVVQDKTTNCATVDGELKPISKATYTPGNVKYVWAPDGIGINLVGLDDSNTEMADSVDAGCGLWTEK